MDKIVTSITERFERLHKMAEAVRTKQAKASTIAARKQRKLNAEQAFVDARKAQDKACYLCGEPIEGRRYELRRTSVERHLIGHMHKHCATIMHEFRCDFVKLHDWAVKVVERLK